MGQWLSQYLDTQRPHPGDSTMSILKEPNLGNAPDATPGRNVLVLIDAENQNSEWARRAIIKGTELGCVGEIRAFGNFQLVDRGYAELSLEFGVKCEQVFSAPRKNGCDIAICIAAIESAASGDWDVLVLATGDGDFTALVQHLRRRGKTVVGVAERAHSSLSRVCNEFVCTPDVPESMISHIREILQQKDGEPVSLCHLGVLLRQRNSSLIPRNYGFASLTKVLESAAEEFVISAKGTPVCAVRLVAT